MNLSFSKDYLSTKSGQLQSEYLDGRDNPARVLSMDEVAEALGVHRNTVSAMLNTGTIRAVRAGRTWRIPLSALEEYLDGRDNPPEEEMQ